MNGKRYDGDYLIASDSEADEMRRLGEMLLAGADALDEAAMLRREVAQLKAKYNELLTESTKDAMRTTGSLLQAVMAGAIVPPAKKES